MKRFILLCSLVALSCSAKAQKAPHIEIEGEYFRFIGTVKSDSIFIKDNVTVTVSHQSETKTIVIETPVEGVIEKTTIVKRKWRTN